MTQQDLQHIFESEFNWDNWKKVMNFVFPEFKFNLVQTDLNGDTQAHKKTAGYIKEHGSGKLKDDVTLTLCEILVTDNVRLDRNIKSVRSLVSDLAIPNYQTIIAVFHNADNSKWRFTLVVKELTDDHKIKDKKSDSYTYVFGVGEKGRTAAERFYKLKDKANKSLKDLEDAFSVEALSKKFFTEYKAVYQKFVDDIILAPSRLALFKENSEEKQKKAARDFVKKMMGRMVFLYFLQKKGWLGCKTKWEGGDEQFMKTFVDKSVQDDSFYFQYLEPLFFDTLNAKRTKEDEDCIIQKKNFGKVPYLNGGLFEKDDNHPTALTLTWDNFRTFFETLNSYNFTIIEDDPEFKEVAVDPEMLGHIFENLLEDNKDKGAFYTPKEIVHYMCQESLYEYLKTYLQKNNHWPAEENEAKQVEKALQRFVKQKLAGGIIEYDKPLAQALKQVKICDPAIGSGAFPMGLLNEIYNCVHKLHDESPDKVGDVWGIGKEWQGNKVKLNIIQNSIYGVDIEKGAVDIARLRFWLSLIIDEIDPTPLPNLDYKIMQGNSLLESFEGVDLKFDKKKYHKPIEKAKDLFGNVADKDKQISIAEAMAASDFDMVRMEREFFGTQNPEQKEKIRRKITDFEKKFISSQIEEREQTATSTINTLSKKLNTDRYETLKQKKNDEKSLREAEASYLMIMGAKNAATKIKEGNKPYFLWNLYFLNIIQEGGFDIVIGNPPYVQLQKMGKDADVLENADFKTFARTGDIYSLFYELGFNILKPNGVLTFITSNKWMRAAYGESLRKYFTEKTNPIQLIDFGGFQVFETATVDTNILISKKAPFMNRINTCVLGKGFSLSNMSDYFRQNHTLSTLPSEGAWIVMNSIEHKIKAKIEKIGTPLKDWNVEINYGVKTGFNEAFIIDSNTRLKLLSKSPKAEEIIRPILLGKNVKRYTHQWENLWIIFTRRGIDIDGYPSVKEYLQKFYDHLRPRNNNESTGRKPGSYKWFEIQDNVAYFGDFEKEKIVWGNLALNSQFSLVDKGYYVNAPSAFIATSNLYLLAVLNSKIGDYYIKQLGVSRNGGYYEFKPMFIEQLPIPKIDIAEQEIYAEFVKEIITLKKELKSTEELERELDQVIFRLYGLSEVEIEYILSGNQ